MSSPLFSHRHYKFLAAFAREHLTEDQREALARELRGTNGRFDRERFLEAASGQPRGRDRVRAAR